jgi:hypothetical protein
MLGQPRPYVDQETRLRAAVDPDYGFDDDDLDAIRQAGPGDFVVLQTAPRTVRYWSGFLDGALTMAAILVFIVLAGAALSVLA